MAEYTWTHGSCTVTLDTRELDNLIKKEPERAARIIKSTAFRVESYAKHRAPVDTGALKNSIYTNLYGQSGIARMALNAARHTVVSHRKGKSPSKKTMKKAQAWADKRYIPLPSPKSPYEAIVGPSVEYGIYVEAGTRRMKARPYLGPAVEAARQEFLTKWKDLFA